MSKLQARIMKIIEIILFHKRITKIMQIIECHAIIMNIMKIIEIQVFHPRITKIMEIKTYKREFEINETLVIQYKNKTKIWKSKNSTRESRKS